MGGIKELDDKLADAEAAVEAYIAKEEATVASLNELVASLQAQVAAGVDLTAEIAQAQHILDDIAATVPVPPAAPDPTATA